MTNSVKANMVHIRIPHKNLFAQTFGTTSRAL